LIRKPTVFVLGAGASAPYGFPLGIDLVDQIWAEILLTGANFPKISTRLQPLIDPQLKERLLAGHSKDHVERFANALRGMRPYSIDTFLETRPEFLDVGKAAIADVLLRAEAAADQTEPPVNLDWYRYLLNTVFLRKNVENFQTQVRQLRVVTFNFDRSLERALWNGVRFGFGLDENQAAELVKELRIHHVHGRLGKPNWLYPGSADATKYGATGGDLLTATPKAVAFIRVVHEDGPESDLEKAREALKGASTVYFIGFGFDERNVQKLDMPLTVAKADLIRATVFRLSTAEQSPLAAYFGNRPGLKFVNVDALGFLREHARELFA